MSLQIWIPGGADPGEQYRDRTTVFGRRVIDRCRIPTADGPCGTPFYEGEPDLHRVQHLARCASENHEHILAERRRRHPDVMRPHDPEYVDWLDKNRQGIAAGIVRW